MSRKGSLKRLSSDHIFSDIMVEGEVSRLGLHSWTETLQERTIHFQVVMLLFDHTISSILPLFSSEHLKFILFAAGVNVSTGSFFNCSHPKICASR